MSTRNELKEKWAMLMQSGQTTLEITISTTNKATVEKVKNALANTMLLQFDLSLTWDIEVQK